jgi:hypothetical protein
MFPVPAFATTFELSVVGEEPEQIVCAEETVKVGVPVAFINCVSYLNLQPPLKTCN